MSEQTTTPAELMSTPDDPNRITVMVPVVLEITDSFPSFHEEAASFGPDAPIYKVGRDSFHPFLFYLFSKDKGESGRSLHANVIVSDAIIALAEQWPELLDQYRNRREIGEES